MSDKLRYLKQKLRTWVKFSRFGKALCRAGAVTFVTMSIIGYLTMFARLLTDGPAWMFWGLIASTIFLVGFAISFFGAK